MSFFILLAIAILGRYLGARYLALVMPKGCLYPTAAAFVGALVVNLVQGFWVPWGWSFLGVYFPGAVLGALLPLFVWGVWPFLRILARGR